MRNLCRKSLVSQRAYHKGRTNHDHFVIHPISYRRGCLRMDRRCYSARSSSRWFLYCRHIWYHRRMDRRQHVRKLRTSISRRASCASNLGLRHSGVPCCVALARTQSRQCVTPLRITSVRRKEKGGVEHRPCLLRRLEHVWHEESPC